MLSGSFSEYFVEQCLHVLFLVGAVYNYGGVVMPH